MGAQRADTLRVRSGVCSFCFVVGNCAVGRAAIVCTTRSLLYLLVPCTPLTADDGMKEFFQKLFGKGAKADAQRSAASVPAPRNQPQLFEPFKKGDVVGSAFEVLRKLGEGGFGVVYLVRHRESGGLFALKTFRDEFLADPQTREAFKREASLWSNLQTHPCVVVARWVQEIHGCLFVMMDYVPADSAGRVSLGDYLGNGPIDANTALKWGIQFCQGMEHAAAHGIRCHRETLNKEVIV